MFDRWFISIVLDAPYAMPQYMAFYWLQNIEVKLHRL